MKGSGQLGSVQAVTARCQVHKRSCFCCALCSEGTGEHNTGVCEDRKMLFAALIHTCLWVVKIMLRHDKLR